MVSEIPSLVRMEKVCGNDLLCCVLGLRELQTSVFRVLAKKELEACRIAKLVGRDRTSVQRAVQDLVATGLVTRRSVSVGRGRKFLYRGVGIDRVRARLDEELDAYYLRMKGEIRKLR